MAATDFPYNGTGNFFANRTGACEIAALRDATSANPEERWRKDLPHRGTAAHQRDLLIRGLAVLV